MTATEARQAAIQTVRSAMGLNNDPTSWSYEQRTAYNKALAQYILDNPGDLAPQDLATASTVASKAYSPLEDTSFDWAMFGDELANNAKAVNSTLAVRFSQFAALAVVIFFAVLAWRTAPGKSA